LAPDDTDGRRTRSRWSLQSLAPFVITERAQPHLELTKPWLVVRS
jgi:hypothetical protein